MGTTEEQHEIRKKILSDMQMEKTIRTVIWFLALALAVWAIKASLTAAYVACLVVKGR